MFFKCAFEYLKCHFEEDDDADEDAIQLVFSHLNPLLRGLILRGVCELSPPLPPAWQDLLLTSEWKNHVSNHLKAWQSRFHSVFPERVQVRDMQRAFLPLSDKEKKQLEILKKRVKKYLQRLSQE
jgi:hypothetical protein